MPLPRLLPVRQRFPDRALQDIPGEVHRSMSEAGFAAALPAGSRVAIGVGSRGIANLDEIVAAVVDFWKQNGVRPVIFPAMGSHGGGTAEGQADLLARYGVHEAAMGCPVVSSLDVVTLGRTAEGIEVFMDRQAYESDAVMLVGRVKWHTDFEGKLESGLVKMMAIGMGKLAGAQLYHTQAYRLGMEQVIRSAGRLVLASGRMLGGLAILEDARHQTAMLEAVPAAAMESREEELLALVKSWAGRIPVRALDILVVDEIGKDISGTGMDAKIVNRSINGERNPWPNAPIVERVFVRELTAMSRGNAVGVGMADMVTDRLAARIDPASTYINSLTASTLPGVRTPMHFATDRECLERLMTTVGKVDLTAVTFGWIRNTMSLAVLALSENLRDEIEANPDLEILAPPRELRFDEAGNLLPWSELCAG